MDIAHEHHAPRAFLRQLPFFNQTTSIPEAVRPCQALFDGQTIKKSILGLIDQLPAGGALLLTVFVMTDEAICQALLDAHKRSVAIPIVADSGGAAKQWSKIPRLAKAGIPVYLVTPDPLDQHPPIMHNKFIIIESPQRLPLVLTGSYNLTTSAAEKNHENMVIINQPETVAAFKRHFEKLTNIGVKVPLSGKRAQRGAYHQAAVR